MYNYNRKQTVLGQFATKLTSYYRLGVIHAQTKQDLHLHFACNETITYSCDLSPLTENQQTTCH